MKTEDEMESFKSIENKNLKNPKANKKYKLYRNKEIHEGFNFYELFCLSLFFIAIFVFIIGCIILYISRANKHFVTEEDRIQMKLMDYIKNNSKFNELEKADVFCELCELDLLFKEIKNKTVENPKITIIIITNNNKEKIIKLFRSIQNQNFDEFEILIIDNSSKNETVHIIEKYKREDERIKLIKNKKKKEILMNIKIGLLYSKGEYIMIADPNDLYTDGIFNISYKIAKNNNYDIIGFKVLTINYGIHDIGLYHIMNNTIHQPELSSIMFYEKGYLAQTDSIIWNKLIKKDIFINAINLINDEYLNNNFEINGDSILLFTLFKIAKSFYFINIFGYIYIGEHGSLSKEFRNNLEVFKDNILFLKFIYEKTNNTQFEKDMAFEIFRNQYKLFYSKINNYEKFSKYYKYFNDIFDLYYNCEFISIIDKKKIENIKSIFQKELNNKNILIKTKKRKKISNRFRNL